MLNTVVRQIAFYCFERKVHDERREGELTTERLGEIWLEVQRESLGPAIELKPEYATFWSYIPHFIHAPFYVYAYAFGDCLVNSLYAVYEKADAGFAERYLDMLAAGGTKHHKELLKPFGLDASEPHFWSMGLKVIEGLIDELEAMTRRKRPNLRRSEACLRRVCASVRGEDLGAAVFLHQQHVIGLRRAVRLFHARRAQRHIRHGKPDGIGPFGYEPLDVLRWHMPLDDIAADEAGVAGGEFAPDSRLALEVGEHAPRCVPCCHVEAVLGEMVDPFVAAMAGRRLPHLDGRRRCPPRRTRAP